MCEHNVHEFYDNYEEIMLYYKKKRKLKADLIDQLIEEKDSLWTSKLPVYSTILRPQGPILALLPHNCGDKLDRSTLLNYSSDTYSGLV